jgi:endonuclease/exonuclease/phosphatase family metal-dependent hydrolase
MIRILTYNVHRCLGVDRRLDVGRIADVIAAQAPDIVALQEVDVGRARTGGVDQAHRLADRLGMAFRFNAALQVEEEQYGNAILTTWPERLIKASSLPGYARLPRLEPRGALWVAVEVRGVEIQVINTHLGLIPREQQIQAMALAGPEWLGAPERRDPLVLVGDLNASSRRAACRILLDRLSEARAHAGRRAATFPSAMPIRQIDHVLVSPGVRAVSITAPGGALARRASDHLPLVADLEVDEAGSASPSDRSASPVRDAGDADAQPKEQP